VIRRRFGFYNSVIVRASLQGEPAVATLDVTSFALGGVRVPLAEVKSVGLLPAVRGMYPEAETIVLYGESGILGTVLVVRRKVALQAVEYIRSLLGDRTQ